VYVGIIACILFGYNTLNYLDLRHDIAESKKYAKPDSELTEVPGHASTLLLLVKEILAEDLMILSVAAWISYLFAGYTLRPVQRSLIIQKNFSENASHELRTPLAVIKSDAEVLLRNQNPSEENIKNTLQSIIEEIDRMTVMTDDLLLLARSERQTTVVQKSINMVEVTENIVKKMSALAEKKGVELKIVTNRTSCIVIGDIMTLERVFFNLLQNAITHTPEHGTITVELKKDTGHVKIIIKDTGKGIADKDLPHVFERFYKGESSNGTGLGLPIVKEIIESHRGSVSIRSKIGVGTEVCIKIPCVYSK
jgi:signal transduction histidine kinase